MSDIYYREINARWTDDRLAISVATFPVIRRTPGGVWISAWGREKFVLDGVGKRFAYPTREQARQNFIARKRREIRLTKAQHDRAIRYLALAETMELGTETEALHELRTPDEMILESLSVPQAGE